MLKKIKSFGIIEALVASVVMILVLTGALALSSNLVKSSSVDSSYREVESIAEEIFSSVESARAAGEIEFVASQTNTQKYPIECFDSSFINSGNPRAADCLTTIGDYRNSLPFATLSDNKRYSSDQFDSGGYFSVTQSRSMSIPGGFFKFRSSVVSDGCLGLDGAVTIPGERCRKVLLEVKWEDKNGLQTYKSIERFSDWQS